MTTNRSGIAGMVLAAIMILSVFAAMAPFTAGAMFSTGKETLDANGNINHTLTYQVGDTAHYIVNYTNTDPTYTCIVNLTDVLPDGTVYTFGTNVPFAVGETRIYYYNYTIKASDVRSAGTDGVSFEHIINYAWVNGTNDFGEPFFNTRAKISRILPTGVHSFSVSKETLDANGNIDPTLTYQVGDTAHYIVNYTNTATYTCIVNLTDVLPDGTVYTFGTNVPFAVGETRIYYYNYTIKASDVRSAGTDGVSFEHIINYAKGEGIFSDGCPFFNTRAKISRILPTGVSQYYDLPSHGGDGDGEIDFLELVNAVSDYLSDQYPFGDSGLFDEADLCCYIQQSHDLPSSSTIKAYYDLPVNGGNDNGEIDRSELVNAVLDYLLDTYPFGSGGIFDVDDLWAYIIDSICGGRLPLYIQEPNGVTSNISIADPDDVKAYIMDYLSGYYQVKPSIVLVLNVSVTDNTPGDLTDPAYTDITIDVGVMNITTCAVFKSDVGFLPEVPDVTELPTVKPPGIASFSRDVANNTVTVRLYVGDPLLAVVQPGEPREIYIDIKPGSCPNPLNLVSKGVLPVAVLGTEDFDVTIIDPDTILLTIEDVEGGVAPIRWSYEDVATPFTGELCDCHDLNGDGYMDLTLKFDTQAVVTTLGLNDYAGGTIPLTITGKLKEEAGRWPIEGYDCLSVLKTSKK